MKIEIDLNDVFRDEDGEPGETLQESVRRQIIAKLEGDMRKRLFDRIDVQLSEIMQKQLAAAVSEKMPALLDDIMNAKYTPVSSYGQRGEPTTFRDEIVRSISANMKYEPRNYSSEENAFTRAVKSVVEKKTNEIQKALTDQVDAKFKEDALRFAVAKLSERLGLSK